jgi:dsDNA-specific endonuclease/ATPase MutS2
MRRRRNPKSTGDPRKGNGILKKRVRAVLQRHPSVADFSDAGFGGGGWGATRAQLRKGSDSTNGDG